MSGKSGISPELIDTRFTIENYERVIKRVIDILLDHVEIMKTHQTSERVTKGVSTAASVIGATLMFTPFFPVAAFTVVTSAVLGVGSTIADFVKENASNDKLQGLQNELEKASYDFHAGFDKSSLNKSITLANKKEISIPTAFDLVVKGAIVQGVGIIGATVTAVDVGKTYLSAGNAAASMTVAENTGTKGALAAGTTAAKTVSKVFVVGGAIFSIVDLVMYSSDNLEKSNTVIAALRQELNQLENYKKYIKDIQQHCV
ncbi:unnamed protein product [Meganyctiphanes norvegica]|uniref:Uncharacterized protein n=1 Tax=Meganyctiphanes norvegica TaxID=48144 RepID=A0AAV2RLB5_MEGNR